MSLTAERIREFLRDSLNTDIDDIRNDTLLLSSSRIDSFAMVEIVLFLEGEANIKMRPTDVSLENLDSIDRMLAFVARQQADG